VKKIELFCGDYGDRNFAVYDLSFNATMLRTGLSRNKFSTLSIAEAVLLGHHLLVM
jgi:hypothetical protein